MQGLHQARSNVKEIRLRFSRVKATPEKTPSNMRDNTSIFYT